MSGVTEIKTYSEPPFCEREIMRYSGCEKDDGATLDLIRSCIDEVRGKLTYKVCRRKLPININDDICDFELFCTRSKNLADNLKNCKSVIVFAATVGVTIDRLISRYSRISPSRALIFQAIGAERIEALCDVFCAEAAKEEGAVLAPRFSPGYGDLPLSVQRDIFGILDCPRKIGVSLNDSLLMSPSKSVTAFAGISSSEEGKNINKCAFCDKINCLYRGVSA